MLVVSAQLLRGAAAAHADVVVVRTPNDGIQPQIARDVAGVMHLIYFRGSASAGDIWYVRQADGETTWSAPIQVNSQRGSAIATGSVRGAQLAVGPGGRVHVTWNGSETAQPKALDRQTPMVYSRLNDSKTAFEPQRNLITWAAGIDGGGSVAADQTGRVFVAWHAAPSGQDDSHGAVFLTRSLDEGRTFEREKRINSEDTGACACCGMRMLVNAAGQLFALYRSADHNVDRSTTLLVSDDGGGQFKKVLSDTWKANVCPMSTASLWLTGPRVLAAWETQDHVYFAGATSTGSMQPIAPPGTAQRKHPTVASNDKGETVLAWLEGTAWNRGGSLAWQVFDPSGRPTERRGRAAGAPAWDVPSVTVRPDGTFLIVY